MGMCIAANKINGVRAALPYNAFAAEMAREHNNANIICLGGRSMEHRTALNIVKTWLSSRFSGDERHRRRLKKVEKLER